MDSLPKTGDSQNNPIIVDSYSSSDEIDSDLEDFLYSQVHHLSVEDVNRIEEKEVVKDVQEVPVLRKPKKTGARRYYLEKLHNCHSCGQKGHFSKDCAKKCPICYLCGQMGHYRRGCPNELCYNCQEIGHRVKSCSVRRKPLNERCSRCHWRGHNVKKCPDYWRQYHITVTDEEIIKPTDGRIKHYRRKYCYNCGARGHYGHECKRERLSWRIVPSPPFVKSYDSSFELRNKEDCNILRLEKTTPNSKAKHHHSSKPNSSLKTDIISKMDTKKPCPGQPALQQTKTNSEDESKSHHDEIKVGKLPTPSKHNVVTSPKNSIDTIITKRDSKKTSVRKDPSLLAEKTSEFRCDPKSKNSCLITINNEPTVTRYNFRSPRVSSDDVQRKVSKSTNESSITVRFTTDDMQEVSGTVQEKKNVSHKKKEINRNRNRKRKLETKTKDEPKDKTPIERKNTAGEKYGAKKTSEPQDDLRTFLLKRKLGKNLEQNQINSQNVLSKNVEDDTSNRQAEAIGSTEMSSLDSEYMFSKRDNTDNGRGQQSTEEYTVSKKKMKFDRRSNERGIDSFGCSSYAEAKQVQRARSDDEMPSLNTGATFFGQPLLNTDLNAHASYWRDINSDDRNPLVDLTRYDPNEDAPNLPGYQFIERSNSGLWEATPEKPKPSWSAMTKRGPRGAKRKSYGAKSRLEGARTKPQSATPSHAGRTPARGAAKARPRTPKSRPKGALPISRDVIPLPERKNPPRGGATPTSGGRKRESLNAKQTPARKRKFKQKNLQAPSRN